MADEEQKDAHVSSSLPLESIRVIAESVGISGLGDDPALMMADDATYRLKQLVQESLKLTRHGKRRRTTTTDFDHALTLGNIEPLYGFHAPDFIPFRHASGGGRELHFTEEKELDLLELVNSPLPRIPLDVTIKAHWLGIDGEQPSIPENPPPVSKDTQKQESMDPAVKAMTDKRKIKPLGGNGNKKSKVNLTEMTKLKAISKHELSVEQQLYYKEITEACVGSDENRRSEALQSLATDPGLHQMLPRFSTFILEGVKINVVQNNLALLIYLMRMVKSLMDNSTLYLEKYLHEMVPAIATCIVSKQLCMRPDVDNHWALRDFAARLMAQLCRTFSTNTNSIQTRVTKSFCLALEADKCPLATHYGALGGLCELGAEVMKAFVLPLLKTEGEKLKHALEGLLGNNADKIAAERVTQLLLKNLPAVLKTIHSSPDSLDEYKLEYGYLGGLLFTGVVKARQTPPAAAATPTVTTRPTISINPQVRHPVFLPSPLVSATTPRTPVTPRFPGTPIPASTLIPRVAGGAQKYVIVTSQARAGTTPSTSYTAASPSVFGNSALKVVTSGGARTTANPAQKIMVVSVSQQGAAGAGKPPTSLLAHPPTVFNAAPPGVGFSGGGLRRRGGDARSGRHGGAQRVHRAQQTRHAGTGLVPGPLVLLNSNSDTGHNPSTTTCIPKHKS